MRHAYQPLPEALDSSDGTGAVTVTLAEHGQRVTRVLVAANWRDLLPPEALGAAVMEAVLAPQLASLQDFLAAMNGGAPAASGTPPPPPPPPPDPDAVARVSRLDWDDLGRMLDTVQRAFDTIAVEDPGALAGAGAGTVAGSSNNRMVEVSLAGGQLSDVSVNEQWAARAGRQSVCDSLREAFEAAYAADTARSERGSGDGLTADLQSIVELFGGTAAGQERSL